MYDSFPYSYNVFLDHRFPDLHEYYLSVWFLFEKDHIDDEVGVRIEYMIKKGEARLTLVDSVGRLNIHKFRNKSEITNVILSTVVAMIIDYASEKKPGYILYTPENPRYGRVFDKIISRYLAKMGYYVYDYSKPFWMKRSYGPRIIARL